MRLALRGRRRAVMAGAVVGVLVIALAATVAARSGRTAHARLGATSAAGAFPRSPFRVPLDPARVRTAGGQSLARLLVATGTPGLSAGPYSTAVYVAGRGTPRYRLAVLEQGDNRWGDSALTHQSVPIPDGVALPPGTDRKLVVVDPDTRQVFDLEQPQRTASGWQVTWGGIFPIDGDGLGHELSVGTGPDAVPAGHPLSRATGSGVSSLSGLVTLADVASGRIDHALSFSSSLACGPAQTGRFVYPATTTDGPVTTGPCIPEGARIALDPSVDVTRLGLPPALAMVATALQRYGAYCIDTGGDGLAFNAQLPVTAAQRDEYARAGLGGGYNDLSALPWGALRVLD